MADLPLAVRPEDLVPGRRWKVLGFDSWARGSHHFERLVDAFAVHGLDLQLLHLGSWGNEPGRPGRERIGRLPVRDIASYGGQSFAAILDLEAPDLVIFLSVETFAHRAFNRLCRARGIPTLNLYHGLIGTFYANDRDENLQINRAANLRIVLGKLSKTLRRTVPCYIGALLRTRASAGEWLRFVIDTWRLAGGKAAFVASDDAGTTACAVYTTADVSHAAHKYRVPLDNIYTVGNPDLDAFGLSAHDLGRHLTSPPKHSRTVMYVETGLLSNGIMVRSVGEYLEHVAATFASLRAQGFRLLFKHKPHASTGSAELLAELSRLGVERVTNDEFLGRLEECCACLVEYTSLAVIPALTGMPVFLVKYGKLGDMRFGHIMTSYPRSFAVTDIAAFAATLDVATAGVDHHRVREWIAANVGPLPVEEIPNRIAVVAHDLVRSAQSRTRQGTVRSRSSVSSISALRQRP